MKVIIDPFDILALCIVFGTIFAFIFWKIKKSDSTFTEYLTQNLPLTSTLAFIIMAIIVLAIRIITKDPTL